MPPLPPEVVHHIRVGLNLDWNVEGMEDRRHVQLVSRTHLTVVAPECPIITSPRAMIAWRKDRYSSSSGVSISDVLWNVNCDYCRYLFHKKMVPGLAQDAAREEFERIVGLRVSATAPRPPDAYMTPLEGKFCCLGDERLYENEVDLLIAAMQKWKSDPRRAQLAQAYDLMRQASEAANAGRSLASVQLLLDEAKKLELEANKDAPRVTEMSKHRSETNAGGEDHAGQQRREAAVDQEEAHRGGR